MMNTAECVAEDVAIPAMVRADVTEASLQLWADGIKHTHQRSVAAIMAVGRVLIEAKASLRHGEWGRLFKGHPQAVARPAPFSQRTAEQLMIIANHPTLSNSRHGSNLPLSWRTLAELARLEPAVLEKYLATGRVHSELTRDEADYLREKSRPQPVRPSSQSGSTRIDESDASVYLKLAEPLLRRYSAEVVADMKDQLQFVDSQGRVTIRAQATHTCPECGLVHCNP